MRMQHWEIDKLVLSQLSAWEEILQAALKKETGCFSLLERLHKKCAISIGVLMKSVYPTKLFSGKIAKIVLVVLIEILEYFVTNNV